MAKPLKVLENGNGDGKVSDHCMWGLSSTVREERRMNTSRTWADGRTEKRAPLMMEVEAVVGINFCKRLVEPETCYNRCIR